MNDLENTPLPVLLPRNKEEQDALSDAFAKIYKRFASHVSDDKFEGPQNSIASLRKSPILDLVRKSSTPDPKQNKDAFKARSETNDKDRSRGFPYNKFSVWQRQENGEKTLITSWERTGPNHNILGDKILELEVLKRLKPYFSSTLNQSALSGCTIHYLHAALSFYLPSTAWINALGGHLGINPNMGFTILLSEENQFQLTFTLLGFKKSDEPENKEYSDNTFSITLNLTFNSDEKEMPSKVTLSKVELTPFSPELSKAIEAQKVLQRKLNDISFIAKKLSDPIYCHLIITLIFIEKIDLNQLLGKVTPQQKTDLLKNIFGRQEFSNWFNQLSELKQDYLLDKTRALPLHEKINICTNLFPGKAKKTFAEDIGWSVTTENIKGLSDTELSKIVLLDKDPQSRVLKKIIEDARKPIESYNFFETRFPRLFSKKRTQNQDIIERKLALRLLLSTNLSLEDSTSKETLDYLTNAGNKKTFAEALLSNVTLLDKLKIYQFANDLLKREITAPIKNSEEFGSASVSDLLQDGATATVLATFAKLKSGETSEIALNETTEAIIKGAGKQTKPLNFFERNFPRIFTRKARENREIKVQQQALHLLVSSDKTLAGKILQKIVSLDTPWSEKFDFIDALPKSVDYVEHLKSQAKIFSSQAFPDEEFTANAETCANLAKILPVDFQNMSVDDIKEGNTSSGIHKFFLGQYTYLCLPLDYLPQEEDFANDATIQKCCDVITQRIQQIKKMLGTLTFVATLENSTSTSKQQIIDSALQNGDRRSDLANLIRLPHDPYGVRACIEGKDTFDIAAPNFEQTPFVRQEIPAKPNSTSISKIVAATMGENSPRGESGTPELLRISGESSIDSEELEEGWRDVVDTTPKKQKPSDASEIRKRTEKSAQKINAASRTGNTSGNIENGGKLIQQPHLQPRLVM